MLGEGDTVAGVAVVRSRVDERREEIKVMFGKRQEVFEEGILVIKVVNKLRED